MSMRADIFYLLHGHDGIGQSFCLFRCQLLRCTGEELLSQLLVRNWVAEMPHREGPLLDKGAAILTADGNEGRTHTGIAGQIVVPRLVVQLCAADDVLHLRQPDGLPVIILRCIGPVREIQADLESYAELGLLAVRRVRRHQLPQSEMPSPTRMLSISPPPTADFIGSGSMMASTGRWVLEQEGQRFRVNPGAPRCPSRGP